LRWWPLRLNAGAGALILFGMVQVSMIGIGRLQGQRLHARQVQGGVIALLGLVALTLPLGASLASPPLGAAAMMAAAGIAWGIYSVRGRTSGDPVASTARNFLLSVPFVLTWWWTRDSATHMTMSGALLAATSGALTSGLGYVIWYRALRNLLPVEAALVQLSVPVLTALAGVWLMGEPLTARLAISGTLILMGIALAVLRR
jgi:drug/metabolite transporter (DMT)-like permease